MCERERERERKRDPFSYLSIPFFHFHYLVPFFIPLSLRPSSLIQAVTNVKDTDRMSELTHEIRIAYKLLLDAKRDKSRIADMVLAHQDSSQTTPACTPKITGVYFSVDRIVGKYSISPQHYYFSISPYLCHSNFSICSFSPSIPIFIYLPLYISASLSIFLSIFLSILLSILLSIFLSQV